MWHHTESTSDEDDADDLTPATASPAAATGTTSTSAAAPAAAVDNCCEMCLLGRRTCAVRPRAFLRFLRRQNRRYFVLQFHVLHFQSTRLIAVWLRKFWTFSTMTTSSLKKLSISIKIGVIKRYGDCLVSFQIVDRIHQQSSWVANCVHTATPTRHNSTVASRRRRRCVMCIGHKTSQVLI